MTTDVVRHKADNAVDAGETFFDQFDYKTGYDPGTLHYPSYSDPSASLLLPLANPTALSSPGLRALRAERRGS